MTRFNISINEGVDLVLYALRKAFGGEIFVPKIPSYRIMDVAEAIGPECEHRIVGIRQGEKIHEEMITASDSPNTLDLGEVYADFTCVRAYSAKLLHADGRRNGGSRRTSGTSPEKIPKFCPSTKSDDLLKNTSIPTFPFSLNPSF